MTQDHQGSPRDLLLKPQSRRHCPPVHLNRHLLSTYQVQGTVRCHKRYRVTIWSLPARSSQSRGRQHSTQLAAATPARVARARSETPSAVGSQNSTGLLLFRAQRRLRAEPGGGGCRAEGHSRRKISMDRANWEPRSGSGWSEHHGRGQKVDSQVWPWDNSHGH